MPEGIARDPDYTGPAGLDLASPAMLSQCRRLVLSCPAFRQAVAGGALERRDLEQVVLLALVSRQRSQSRFDRRRSSLGRYVWLVARSVTLNELEKHHRRLTAGPVITSTDAALIAADIPAPTDVDTTPASVVDAMVYRVTGGVDPATATSEQALGWRARGEDSAGLVLACRIAEGLYLLRQRERRGAGFSAWVRQHHAGSAKGALDRVYVAWYATRSYRGSLDRLAARPWRQLRETARAAFVAHHGLGRHPKPKPARAHRDRAIARAIASARRASTSPHWAAVRLLIPELDDLVDWLAELDPGTA